MDTILIYDKQFITRIGLTYILSQTANYDIKYSNTKKELVELLMQYPDSLVIIDYTMSDVTGIDGLLNIMSRFSDSSWFLFSEEFTPTFIKKILVASTNTLSILSKQVSEKEIKECLGLIAKKQQYLSVQIKEILLDEKSDISKEKLTITEHEILKEIVLGNSAKQIAQKRNLSIHTIVTHKKNIYRKLQINTVQEAYVYAMRAGIFDMSDYSI